MANLHDSLTEVALLFSERRSVTWTLMQTSNEGQKGYAFLVLDHEPPRAQRSNLGGHPAVIANLTSRSLADLGDLLHRWIEQEKRKRN